MIEIVYHVASSLDGFIAAPDGGVGWLSPFEQPGCDHGLAEFFASLDALLFGRRTYEQSLTFGNWPYEGKPCWVFSRSPLGDLPVGVTVTAEAPATVAAMLEARGLRRAWLVGGAALASSFRDAKLISEYAIAVVPIILGAGVPLFGSAGVPENLKLVETKTYPTGIVLLRYHRNVPAADASQS